MFFLTFNFLLEKETSYLSTVCVCLILSYHIAECINEITMERAITFFERTVIILCYSLLFVLGIEHLSLVN